VEATKLSTNPKIAGEGERNRALSVLLNVLVESLKLLHPLLPLVTEEIYSKVKEALNITGSAGRDNSDMLILASYPQKFEGKTDSNIESDFSLLQNIITGTRTLRSECTIAPLQKLTASIHYDNDFPKTKKTFIEGNVELLKMLAGLLEISFAENTAASTAQKGNIGIAFSGFEAFVNITGAVDTAALNSKFSKEIEKEKKYIVSLEAKLANENYIKNAPADLVETERTKLKEEQMRKAKLKCYCDNLM
jgi:valyl-tRNA synthetase